MTKKMVVLRYFKMTGKYYHQSAYVSEKEFDFEIYAEVRDMRDSMLLPGLTTESVWEGYILVVPENGVEGLIT